MLLALNKDKNLTIAVLMTIVIFMADLFSPLWYQIRVLYIIPLFFMYQSAKRPCVFSVVITLLVATRLSLSLSDSTPLMHDTVTRITGIFGRRGVSVLLMRFRA